MEISGNNVPKFRKHYERIAIIFNSNLQVRNQLNR